MQWADKAACKGMPLLPFFPASRDGVMYGQGKAVCATCPVTAECLQYAIDTDSQYGLFGGMTPYERQRHTFQQRWQPDIEQAHGADGGTIAGYWRERKAGAPHCDACRGAYNLYYRQQRASRREAIAQ